MSVELLPGAPLSPAVHLHRVLEDAADLRGVLVVTLDADEKMQVSWSNLPVASLAMASVAVQARVAAAIFGEGCEVLAP